MLILPYQLYTHLSPKVSNVVIFFSFSPDQNEYSGNYLINIFHMKNK